MNVFKQRILNVAQALRDSPNPTRFTMCSYGHCGTPACALGHYASRQDLQDEFYLGAGEGEGLVVNDRYCIQAGVSCCGETIREHFGLNESEAFRLFNIFGCGSARTASAAADYLEKFACEKWPQSQRPTSELVSDLITRITSGERIPEDA